MLSQSILVTGANGLLGHDVVKRLVANGRQVVAVDLHGHGRTPLGNRKINMIDIGDDLAVIL